MHLTTLTMRGFKSFASATTLRFEPGITCVVGPNGSGKSNVVDALAWVMGEQGARSLRGGSMEDVVFAGTTGPRGRPALGRAEVSLTIDNSDGALPIGYAEVTLTRRMFRAGGSEYAINGSPVRLLDITELLSDSGIGKEMHVIVGQGRLDAILNATPHERRGFVEEAAGVLKHRKRKERALRKLEAMQANLVRLSDLSAEVRRQLGPLARQADVARRAQVVQAEVRDARSRLLADDLVQAESALADDLADERAHLERRGAAQDALAAARAELDAAQAAQEEVTPRLAASQESYFALHALRERLRSLNALAQERERGLRPAAVPAARTGRDVDSLLADAERAREAEASLQDQVEREAAALERASGERATTEATLAAHERARADAARARADARERLAGAAGQVGAHRSRAEAARDEAERATAALVAARARADQAATALSGLAPQGHGASGTDEADERGGETSTDALEAASASAGAAFADAEASMAHWRDAERDADRDRAGAAARAEALELGLRERRDGTGALLDHGGHLPGVLGSFAGLLHVQAGAEDVVAAALGSASEAVAVESLEAAVDALRLLRERDAGRAEIAIARPAASGRGGRRAAHALRESAEAPSPTGAGASLDGLDGARPLLSLVSAPPALAGTLAQLLGQHVAVRDLAAARVVLGVRADLVAVTADGDVLRADSARGGSPGAGGAPSRLHVQSALSSARAALAEATARAEEASGELARATTSVALAREELSEALAALAARDAAAAAGARALGEASGAARAADAEVARLMALAERAQAAARDGDTRLAQALERQRALVQLLGESAAESRDELDVDESAPGHPGSTGVELASAAVAARSAEVDARLALRTAQERLRGMAGRAEGLTRAARAEEVRAREANARATAAASRLAVVVAVRAGSAAALAVARQSLLSAGLARDDAETDAAAIGDRVSAARTAADGLGASLAALTDFVHRDELVRAERTARVEALRARAREELSTDPDDLVAEFGPDRPVPVLGAPSDVAAGQGPQAGEAQAQEVSVPYVRSDQEARLRRGEKDLARLGTVNPLALEEFAALEERSAFLVGQLDDLATARADLLEIIREIDERVQEVFAAAFVDTAAAFEGVFARLFPGGEGRLVLTDPDDPLSTGIEVEARPAGKRVKRLALLSGGERSLTAIAILVAIFMARPSPFYVLDEVEAALDDANLRRLLAVLDELRASSQLIVITHQERTMEIADSLYGVSMRGDGVSAVVSQRLRSGQPLVEVTSDADLDDADLDDADLDDSGPEGHVVDLREKAPTPMS